jgi:hypothetical protein
MAYRPELASYLNRSIKLEATAQAHQRAGRLRILLTDVILPDGAKLDHVWIWRPNKFMAQALSNPQRIRLTGTVCRYQRPGTNSHDLPTTTDQQSLPGLGLRKINMQKLRFIMPDGHDISLHYFNRRQRAAPSNTTEANKSMNHDLEEDYIPLDGEEHYDPLEDCLDAIADQPTTAPDDDIHECRTSSIADLCPLEDEYSPSTDDEPVFVSDLD